MQLIYIMWSWIMGHGPIRKALNQSGSKAEENGAIGRASTKSRRYVCKHATSKNNLKMQD